MTKKGDHGTVGYSPEKLKEFEDSLQAMRLRILKGFDDLREETDSFKNEAQPDAYDDASNQVELNIQMMLSDGQKRELDQIAMALLKIREGTYGVCEGCGQLIAEKRLRALPFAQLCVECKGKEERGTVIVQRDTRSVPLDEDFLVAEGDEEDY